MENVNPGAALRGMTQILVIPGSVVKTARNTAMGMGKHLHCRAEVTQRESFICSLWDFLLSCKPHPQEHPKSTLSFLPQKLKGCKSGAHTQTLSPSSQRWNLGSPSMQDEKVFWSQSCVKIQMGFTKHRLLAWSGWCWLWGQLTLPWKGGWLG